MHGIQGSLHVMEVILFVMAVFVVGGVAVWFFFRSKGGMRGS